MKNTNTITLVHGTSSRHLKSILKHGIHPRGEAPSVWEKCPSNPRMVYLSKVYALYYAMQASSVERGDDAVMFEVEVPTLKLYPDEDFMAHVMEDDFKLVYPGLIQRTLACRSIVNLMKGSTRREHLNACLQHLGNAAYCGVIQPRMIRRVAVIPQSEFSSIIFTKYDPCPIPINFKIMGGMHMQTQNEIFDEYEVKVTT